MGHCAFSIMSWEACPQQANTGQKKNGAGNDVLHRATYTEILLCTIWTACQYDRDHEKERASEFLTALLRCICSDEGTAWQFVSLCTSQKC